MVRVVRAIELKAFRTALSTFLPSQLDGRLELQLVELDAQLCDQLASKTTIEPQLHRQKPRCSEDP